LHFDAAKISLLDSSTAGGRLRSWVDRISGAIVKASEDLPLACGSAQFLRTVVVERASKEDCG